nr:hypothetical protein [uncultured Methylophaga sp.]
MDKITHTKVIFTGEKQYFSGSHLADSAQTSKLGPAERQANKIPTAINIAISNY